MNEKIEKAKKKAKDFGRKAIGEAKRFGIEAVEFANRNKEVLIVAAPVVIAGIKSRQSLMVNRRIKGERKRIDHTYYDPQTGMHWELKRKASNADRAEILRRKKAGQDVYDILRQMNLIR